MANESSAVVPELRVGDRLKDGREVAYVIPDGYREQALNLYGWLRYEGLTPGYAESRHESGWTATAIVLPPVQIPMVHGLQRSNPARYGNPPETVAHLKAERDHLVLTIDATDGAAFLDTGLENEAARIIGVAANKLREHARAREIGSARGVEQTEDMSFELTDLNGNVVGKVERVGYGALSDEPSDGAVFLYVDIPVDGLSAANLHAASKQFREAADLIERGEQTGLILNGDGYMAGRFIAERLTSPELNPSSDEHDVEP